jgi:hypothetical protein
VRLWFRQPKYFFVTYKIYLPGRVLAGNITFQARKFCPTSACEHLRRRHGGQPHIVFYSQISKEAFDEWSRQHAGNKDVG